MAVASRGIKFISIRFICSGKLEAYRWRVVLVDGKPESDIFTTRSKFGKTIRLTKTTWLDKMLKDHPELSARKEYIDEVKRTVEDPDYIVSGWFGEYLALRFCEVAPRRPKYLCVVYRELDEEGFVITAFFISKPYKLLRRGVLWRKQS